MVLVYFYIGFVLLGFICGLGELFSPNSQPQKNPNYQTNRHTNHTNYPKVSNFCENKYNSFEVKEVIDEKGRVRKEENRSNNSYPISKFVAPPTSMTSIEELEKLKTSDYADVDSSEEISLMAQDYILMEQLRESF